MLILVLLTIVTCALHRKSLQRYDFFFTYASARAFFFIKEHFLLQKDFVFAFDFLFSKKCCNFAANLGEWALFTA